MPADARRALNEEPKKTIQQTRNNETMRVTTQYAVSRRQPPESKRNQGELRRRLSFLLAKSSQATSDTILLPGPNKTCRGALREAGKRGRTGAKKKKKGCHVVISERLLLLTAERSQVNEGEKNDWAGDFTVKMTTFLHRSAVMSSPDRAKILKFGRQVIHLLIPGSGLVDALWVLRQETRFCRANTIMQLCMPRMLPTYTVVDGCETSPANRRASSS